jgi:hypothetical protein
VFGPDIIEDAEQLVQQVRENLRVAQTHQKSYADIRQRDLTFTVDYHVCDIQVIRDIDSKL